MQLLLARTCQPLLNCVCFHGEVPGRALTAQRLQMAAWGCFKTVKAWEYSLCFLGVSVEVADFLCEHQTVLVRFSSASRGSQSSSVWCTYRRHWIHQSYATSVLEAGVPLIFTWQQSKTLPRVEQHESYTLKCRRKACNVVVALALAAP